MMFPNLISHFKLSESQVITLSDTITLQENVYNTLLSNEEIILKKEKPKVICCVGDFTSG